MIHTPQEWPFGDQQNDWGARQGLTVTTPSTAPLSDRWDHWSALALSWSGWLLVGRVDSYSAHVQPSSEARTCTRSPYRLLVLPWAVLFLQCLASQIPVTNSQNSNFCHLSLMRLQLHLGSTHPALQWESVLRQQVGEIVGLITCLPSLSGMTVLDCMLLNAWEEEPHVLWLLEWEATNSSLLLSCKT